MDWSVEVKFFEHIQGLVQDKTRIFVIIWQKSKILWKGGKYTCENEAWQQWKEVTLCIGTLYPLGALVSKNWIDNKWVIMEAFLGNLVKFFSFSAGFT